MKKFKFNFYSNARYSHMSTGGTALSTKISEITITVNNCYDLWTELNELGCYYNSIGAILNMPLIKANEWRSGRYWRVCYTTGGDQWEMGQPWDLLKNNKEKLYESIVSIKENYLL